ncbi:hypothetical protein Sulac_0430 [Sulfobacillus acidophilus DSM 10332]|uniref:Uncharacterized protein n=1 Tax=Sulfobacillus acidophilus (strain ATCC 700253 / DSM 10332 / NAL) TaxID=679936 RepID=G8TYM5_SULAD|nr:hypothetical protein Sulac_0430 [Sulfobacillus acidophilus DSM 10332]
MIGVGIGNGLYEVFCECVTPAFVLLGSEVGMALGVGIFANVSLFFEQNRPDRSYKATGPIQAHLLSLNCFSHRPRRARWLTSSPASVNGTPSKRGFLNPTNHLARTANRQMVLTEG